MHQPHSTPPAVHVDDALDNIDDDDWTKRAWTTFSKVARRGVLSTEQFVTWAGELNVECDPVLVQRIIPEENWNAITYDMALKTLEAIPNFVMNDELLENEGDDIPENLVKLGPFSYIWTVYLCGTKNPTKEYELSFSCHLSPRFWLLANATGVFLVIAAIIIILMAFLWRQNAISRHESNLRLLESTLALFMNSIGTNSLDIAGADLLDQSVTATRWMEFMWKCWVNETKDVLSNELFQTQVLVEKAAERSVDLDIAEMWQRLNQLGAISDAGTLGLPIVLGMVQKWLVGDTASSGALQNVHTVTALAGGDHLWEAAVVSTHTGMLQWQSENIGRSIQDQYNQHHELFNTVNSSQIPLLSAADIKLSLDHPPGPLENKTWWRSTTSNWCLRQLLNREEYGHRRASGMSLSGVANSTVLFRFFPSEAAGICLSLTPRSAQQVAAATLVQKINDINAEEIVLNGSQYSSVKPEIMLAGVGTPTTRPHASPLTGNLVSSDGAFAFLTKPIFVNSVCEHAPNEEGEGSTLHTTVPTVVHKTVTGTFAPNSEAVCQSFEQRIQSVYDTQRTTPRLEESIYYNTDQALVGSFYVPSAGLVLTQSILLTAIQDDFKNQMIRAVNFINQNLNSTIEIVWAARNSLGKIVAQVTDFRFLEDCYVECVRIPESLKTIIDAFGHQGEAFALYPDYRPAPIVGGVSYMREGFDMTLVVERDVTELRQINLDQLSTALNDINTNFKDSTEITLFRQDGMPVSDTFIPSTPCKENVICTTDPELGILARNDCADCLRRPEFSSVRVLYNTDLRFKATRCPTCTSSSGVLPQANNDLVNSVVAPTLAAETISDQSQELGAGSRDYGEVEIRGSVSYLSKFSSFVMIKRDFSDIVDPVTERMLYMTAVGAGCVLLGVIGLIVLSRRTLNRIEREWRTYKESIEGEKQKFDDMIKEIVPGSVLAKFKRGQRIVAEMQPILSYAYVDVCGFSERFKGKGAREVVRTVAYYFILYDAVATKYSLFRLKTFGDVSVFVSGIDSKKTDPTGALSAYSIACFAGYLVQLLSPVFAHYPQRLSKLRDTFKGEDTDAPLEVLPLRIGLHSGPVSSGLVDVGNTPFYEHYGPTLALAHRLQATCQPCKAHASSTFKDLLDTVDVQGAFEWDSLRKTMVKNRGTITSYPLRSVQLVIDDYLLSRLKIEYAKQMFMFSNKNGPNGGDGSTQRGSQGGGSDTESTLSSILSSKHSSGGSRKSARAGKKHSDSASSASGGSSNY